MPRSRRHDLRELSERLRRFGRDFTAGLSRRDLERLFDEDAARAFAVLSADQRRHEGPEEGLRGFISSGRAFFLGLAFKLSPPRRVLFAVSLLCPLLGFFDVEAEIGPFGLYIDFSPLWFLASLTGLTLLLALELTDRLRVRDELEVARELQRELLPSRDPEIPGYRVAHSSRTANEIGGDYYDFLPLAGGRVAIAIGDASGHGMAAGLVMAIANASLRTALDLDPRPVEVLAFLNRVLWRTGGRKAFMTFFYALLHPATGTLEHAGAGHPFPLLRRASGEVEELGEGRLPLGLHPQLELRAGRTELAPGDLLVLYSDGLPESVGGEPEEAFGFERLRALVAPGGSPREVHDRIVAAFEAHLGERSVNDDLTLVVVAREGA